tara:strand:+ start:889 stop:1029 length:141 start_codon:yes stop_codon:yes gene_type:complete
MIRRINPIARALALFRRRSQTYVVPPKKGKGSYNRKKVIKDYQKGE